MESTAVPMEAEYFSPVPIRPARQRLLQRIGTFGILVHGVVGETEVQSVFDTMNFMFTMADIGILSKRRCDRNPDPRKHQHFPVYDPAVIADMLLSPVYGHNLVLVYKFAMVFVPPTVDPSGRLDIDTVLQMVGERLSPQKNLILVRADWEGDNTYSGKTVFSSRDDAVFMALAALYPGARAYTEDRMTKADDYEFYSCEGSKYRGKGTIVTNMQHLGGDGRWIHSRGVIPADSALTEWNLSELRSVQRELSLNRQALRMTLVDSWEQLRDKKETKMFDREWAHYLQERDEARLCW